MENIDDLERLKALEARIVQVKAKHEPPEAGQDHHSMAQVGWRMVIELVSGLGIGAVIGYGLDVLLGTIPLFLVVMTLLGFAAGIRTMLRSARELGIEGDATGEDAGAEQGDDRRGR